METRSLGVSPQPSPSQPNKTSRAFWFVRIGSCHVLVSFENHMSAVSALNRAIDALGLEDGQYLPEVQVKLVSIVVE